MSGSMTVRELHVWCFGQRAGRLTDDGHLRFAYDPQWVADGRPALSQSLPLDGTFDDATAAAFFEGLLPEGQLRDILARRFGVSATNPFSLLEEIGGDCAGAITLLPPGAVPSTDDRVRWLTDRELADIVIELPRRPMLADPDDHDLRLSLAGAQDKLPVVVRDGRVGLPVGGTPSTHILKTPIPGLPATVINEALWPLVGERLGIDCAPSHAHRTDDTEVLLVERYDRSVAEDGTVTRLHQEDFCQTLGIDSAHKYEREGGPGLRDCFALLRRASRAPGRELPKLIDAWALSFLAANHDAHGKNYSLLYGPNGVGLAPVYDVLNTLDYRGVKLMDRKMAMSVGGENRPDYVRRRHLERMLADAGLGVAPALRRLRSLAERAPGAVADARRELVARAWDDAQLDKLVARTEGRASALLAETT
jgi:serine/threonine-protein kinase HipA